jgi:predicted phage baseplate assembly protein
LSVNQPVIISGVANTAFNNATASVNTVVNGTTFTVLTSAYTTAPTGSSTGGTVSGYSYSVPQYTTFTALDANNNNYNFYLLNESSPLTSITSQVTGTIIQGTIIANEVLTSSSGAANQQINLLKKNVDIDSITISVFEGPLQSGTPTAVNYQYVAQLSTSNYIDKVFTAKVTSDGYTQILFGNGFNGYIPTTNAAITASYRTTDGSLGNLPANSIKFVGSNASSYVSIVSSTPSSGGADNESIESIKNNVARLYRAQDRAVSLQDYKDLTLQIPGVSKATATYAANVVTLYPVPHQSTYPPEPRTDTGENKIILDIPQAMTESIENYFSTRSMLGVTASVVNPTDFDGSDKYIECTPVYVFLKLYVQDNYVQSWVKDEVDKAIRDLLSFENVFFEKTLTVGEVYRAALSAAGVDYVDLINMGTTYNATEMTSTVVNVSTTNNKLLCFTDDIGGNLSILITPFGGLTGSSN